MRSISIISSEPELFTTCTGAVAVFAVLSVEVDAGVAVET